MMCHSIPGKYAVERYPALKYIPSIFAPWKAEVLEQRKKDIQLYMGLMDEVREKVKQGTAPDCFATHLLQQQADLGMTDLELAYTAGSPFGAGVETVSLNDSDNYPGAALLTSLSGLDSRISGQFSFGLCQVWTAIHPSGSRGAGQGCGR